MSCAPLAAVAAGGLFAMLSPNAVADVFRFTPILSIEQIFTDNIRADAEDRDADAVTVLTAGFQSIWQTSRINAAAAGEANYNEYWATNELDNANASGTVVGRFTVLRNFFFVDAIAERGEILVTPDDQSASGLTPGQGRLQQTNYSVTPTIQTDVFDLADLLLRAHYGQVIFDEPVVGVTPVLLEDITVKQVAGRITTGQRSSLYEVFAGAEHLETDLGFEMRNVIGGVILHVLPNFSAIGRYGYERIFDPSFPLIHDQVWSAGGILRLGQASTIHVEYGRRFGDVSWLGDLNIVLTPRIALSGGYRDTLTPAQLTLVRGVEDLLDEDGTFDVTTPTAPNVPNPLVIDEVVRDKEANLVASYVYGLRTYALTLNHLDRAFPALDDAVSSYSAELSLAEQLSRQLRYFLSVQYEDNYEVLGAGPTTKIYRAGLTFQYQFTETYTAQGGYIWQLDTTTDDSPDTQQNVLRFQLTRAF